MSLLYPITVVCLRLTRPRHGRLLTGRHSTLYTDIVPASAYPHPQHQHPRFFRGEQFHLSLFIKKKKWENKKLIHQNLNSKNHIHIEQICTSNEDKSRSDDGHSDRLQYLFLDNCTLNPVSGMMGSGG